MARNTSYGSGMGDIPNSLSRGYEQQALADDNFKRKYGLAGLLEKLKKNPKEESTIRNGIDLTAFGLDLNSKKE